MLSAEMICNRVADIWKERPGQLSGIVMAVSGCSSKCDVLVGNEVNLWKLSTRRLYLKRTLGMVHACTRPGLALQKQASLGVSHK
jgi:hypothetical protein